MTEVEQAGDMGPEPRKDNELLRGPKRRTRSAWRLIAQARRDVRVRRGALIGASVVALGAVLFLDYQIVTWPDVSALAARPPTTTAFIEAYKDRRRAAGQSPSVVWRWVPYDRISVHLKRAVVAAEDIEFFWHDGFSRSELMAAIREAIASREAPRGASTITQQLAKNLWLSPSRNPWRKLKEALLTRQLERHLGKRRILELYLNVVEFGPGVYGADAAASSYFDKSSAALTLHESAMLAASLPRPSRWHPGSQSAAYARYVREIEGRMEQADFLWQQVEPSAR